MSRSIRFVTKSKTRLTLLAAVVAALAATLSAVAYWTTSGTGSAQAGLGDLTAATISGPSSTASPSVTINWDAQAAMTPSSQNSNVTYTVERKFGAGSYAALSSGGCSGSKPYGIASCTDSLPSSPTTGTYTYRAIAHLGTSWTATSNEVVVTANLDSAAPTTAITFPGAGQSYNAASFAGGCTPTGICGTATDATGVQVVRVSIRQGTAGPYWDGSAFASFSETFNNATLLSPGGTSTGWTYGLLLPADGSYVLHVQAADTLGNDSAPVYTSTATFSVDATPPTTTDNSASIGNGWKKTNQTVTLTPSDGAGSGVAATYYTSDGSTPTTGSASGTSVALTSDGLYTVKYFSVDNVANQENVKTAGTQIRIDKTSPTPGSFSLPAFVKNGQALTNAATDATVNGASSGVASVHYYRCTGTCTPSPGNAGTTEIGTGSTTGPSYSLTWSGQPADGTYSVLAQAVDVAGNTANSSVATTIVDNTAPTTTDNTATITNGWKSTDVTVTLTPNDGAGSGTAHTYYTSNNSTPTTASSEGTSVVLSAPGVYTIKYFSIDSLGNAETVKTAGTQIRIDKTPPTAPVLTLATATGNTFVSGTTVFINPQASKSGSFQASATTTDGESGILKVNFPSLAGFGGGGGDDASSPYSTAYSWSGAAATAAGAQTVTAFNTATPALTNTSTFTVTPDTTSPTGGSISANGSGADSYNTSGTVAVSSTNFSDSGGSGIATNVITRAAGSLVGNSCGAITGSTTVTVTGGNDTTSLGTGCYRYTLTGTDNVGNQTTAQSAIVMVDRSLPSTPTLAFSGLSANAFYSSGLNTLYIRPAAGGAYTVTASSTDADTGIKAANAGYTFSAIATLTGTQTAGQTAYTFGATATAPGSDPTVFSTNNAGANSLNASYKLVSDTTIQTAGSLTVNGQAASGAGTTSSVNNSTNFTIGARTDYAETQSATQSGLTAAGSVLTVQSETLTGSTCGALGSGGPFTSATMISGTAQPAGIVAGFCYVYKLSSTDNVGNTASVTTTVVDNAVSFTVTAQPSTVTAGVATSATAVTLTAVKNGQTDTGYTGTLAWSGASNSPSGATPTLPTGPTWSSGVATFGITLVKAGSTTLTVGDATRSATFAAITVNAAAAGAIFYVTSSAGTTIACPTGSVTVGNGGNITVFVAITDTLGNVTVNGASAQTITIARTPTSGGGNAPSPASLTVNANATPAVTSGSSVFALPTGNPADTTYTATLGTFNVSCIVKK